MANIHGFEPRIPSGRLFWVDLSESLPLKPISIMDLGPFHGFEPIHLLGKGFWVGLGGSLPQEGPKQA